ncbi:MAG: D-alanine--D-alanine ligase [candidate division KSB1 bacterium]|nr:D-alanine--D-alanine ligase [candidate division KSB1 bacterium]
MSEKGTKLRVLVAYNEVDLAGDSHPDQISEAAVKQEAQAVYEALRRLGHRAGYLPVSDIRRAMTQVEKSRPDVIFNLCEGYRGRAQHELAVAGVWELLGVPYTGNPPLTLGLAQNKVVAKRLFAAAGIRTPAYRVFTAPPEEGILGLNFPVIAKPSQEDASLGISPDSVVQDVRQLRHVTKALLERYRQPVLVEEFIDGREFNVSLLDGDPPTVLPLSEIDYSQVPVGTPRITSYEAKWLPEHPLYRGTPAICPAQVEGRLRRKLEQIAVRVFQLLHGRDYGRVDMRVDAKGSVYVLEFNPNPDISPDAGYARALRAAGVTFEEFVSRLLTYALQRGRNGRN